MVRAREVGCGASAVRPVTSGSGPGVSCTVLAGVPVAISPGRLPSAANGSRALLWPLTVTHQKMAGLVPTLPMPEEVPDFWNLPSSDNVPRPFAVSIGDRASRLAFPG